MRPYFFPLGSQKMIASFKKSTDHYLPLLVHYVLLGKLGHELSPFNKFCLQFGRCPWQDHMVIR